MAEPLSTWPPSPPAAAEPASRPTPPRRAAAIGHRPGWRIRNQSPEKTCQAPAAGIVGGLLVGTFSAGWLETTVLPAQGRMNPVASLLLTMAYWTGAMAAGVLVGLGIALILASPALDALSRRVEERQNGGLPAAGAGLRWELTEAMKASLYFLAAAPIVLLLTLIPLVGAPLGLLWGGHALALQQTDPALTRRGLDFKARRRWHGRFRPESLGFGAAGLVVLLVPLANLLLIPALTVGATRLVMELEDQQQAG